MLKPFTEALDERVLVCDGAMGTMLYAKGVFINKSFDALNVTQPDLVAEVHKEYVRAGADIVETNTFGANRIKLGSFGLADRLHARSERKDDEAVHLALVLGRHEVIGIEVIVGGIAYRHFAGDLVGQIRDVDRLNAANPGLPVDQTFPRRFDPAGKGGNETQAGDHYAAHVRCSG